MHSMNEVPGKVFIHVRGGPFKILCSRLTFPLGNRLRRHAAVGVPFVNEATLIVEIAPNVDGELKVKHVEEFLDSQFTLEFMKAVQASRNREGETS